MRKFFLTAVGLLISGAAAFAQTSAVLSGAGTVFVNGAQMSVPSLSVGAGDVIQTRDNGGANLAFEGSSASVESNSIVRVQNDGVSLDRGSISMATGRNLSVFARDLRITPTSGAWTEFYVMRSSGAIQIMARKNNVSVACGTGNPTLVKEGQQISRLDGGNCGVAQKAGGGAVAAGKAPVLASGYARDAAAAAGAGILIWVLSQGDNPVSPKAP